jgi:cellulase/cellobiase CelA1
LSATYAVGSSWDTGFIGSVKVINRGSAARNWTVTVRHSSAAGVRITDAWNATLSREGDTSTFSGGPLAAGATQSFGFEATKRATGPVKPVACTVNQSGCRVS